MLRSLGRLGLRGDSSGSGAGRRERGGRLGGRGGGSGGPRRGRGARSRGHAEPGGGGQAGRRCPVGSPGRRRRPRDLGRGGGAVSLTEWTSLAVGPELPGLQ
nr:rRNA 2'-O-methyltransferase fibrillarin-like [Microcebus murinus]